MAFRTIRDAAKALGISEMTLRRAVHKGEVPGLRLGNRCWLTWTWRMTS